MVNKKARILLYDIETAYTVGAVWGLYEQNVAKVLREPYIITVSWKWLDEDKIHVTSIRDFPLYKKNKRSDKSLVELMWGLFDEADVIIAHNGNSFDQKWTYARFVVNGMTPPSPSVYIDTKLVAKSKFRFNSNSLNSLAGYFGFGEKLDTDIDLWVDCIENDLKSAWDKMERYNKQDVVLLEKVYLRMRPFMTNHPNMNLLQNTLMACPICGTGKLTKHKLRPTRSGLKQQYQCRSCGSYHTAESVKLDGVVAR